MRTAWSSCRRPDARGACLPRCLAAFALALALCGARAAAPDSAEPLVVAVVLNANLVSDGQIVYPADAGRGYWIDADALAGWRLSADGDEVRRIEGRPHRRVCSGGSSARCTHDEASALLTIEAAPERIGALRLAVPQAPAARADAAAPAAAFVNDDLFASGGSALSPPVLSAQADLRAQSAAGEFYGRTGWLQAGGARRLVSRAAGWTWDWPETQRTLTVGGFISDGALQRGALGIVGARYASNALLRPDLNRMARPWVGGDVARPSRAELYIDGLFRRAAEVPYGRFEFETDGLLAGAGELQMVLTDARGEQTVQRERYYLAPQLLAAGACEFALEAGRAGPDLALLSPSRGSTLVSAQRRQGLSETWTLGGHLLAARGAGQAGLSADHLLRAAGRGLGVVRAGASVHDRGGGARARWLLGHEYQDSRWAASVRAEWSPHDRVAPAPPLPPVAGAADGQLLPSLLPTDRRWGWAALNLTLDSHWQVGASLLGRERITGERNRAAGVSATWRGERRVQVSAALQRLSGARRDTLALIGLVMPLERSHLASVSAARNGNASALQWSVQSVRDPAAGDAAVRDVRIFGHSGERAQAGAGISGEERFGQWAVEAAGGAQRGTSQAAARLSGAIGLAAGRPFAARRIDDGFILVDGDGQAGLPVYLENRFAGVTDGSGFLVVAGARAWQANRISVDSAALPMEYTLAEDQLDVVPRTRAFALARFEVSDGGELVAVRRSDGSVLPAGAKATVSSQRRPAAVNSRSQVFVQRAGRAAQVEIEWPGGTCRFDYRPSEAANAPAAASVFVCA